jgi:hypothetical protein
MTKVISILQEEKSDAIGLDRYIRVKNYELFDEDNWQDKFAELEISVNVKTEIVRIGIIH